MAGGVLIEFFGLPGVGKTTLARGLAADLRQHGHQAIFMAMDAPARLNRYAKLLRQIGAIGRYAVTRPRQILRAVRVVRYFPQPDVVTYAKILRYWLLTYAAVSHSRGQGEVVVCDQGLCQGLYSLALLAPAPDQAAFGAALERIPMPDLIIMVTADEPTVQGRLRGRQYNHRWIDKLLLSDRRYLDRSRQIVQGILVALRATDQSLVVYATSPSITVDTQELAAIVRRHLRGTT